MKYSSESNTDYGVYREYDNKNGFTKEIKRVYNYKKNKNGYMPMCIIKDRDNPINKEYTRVLLNAMNLNYDNVMSIISTTETVPEVGTTGWSKYAHLYNSKYKDIYRDQYEYRKVLVDSRNYRNQYFVELEKAYIGYFGKLHSNMTISPIATYHTLLPLIELNNEFVIENCNYKIDGYVLRVVNGHMEYKSTIEVTAGYVGITHGSVEFSSFTTQDIPDSDACISIKIRLDDNTYRELIIVNLTQSTDGEPIPTGLTIDEYALAVHIPLSKESMLKVSMLDRKRLIAETKGLYVKFYSNISLFIIDSMKYDIIDIIASYYFGSAGGYDGSTSLISPTINRYVYSVGIDSYESTLNRLSIINKISYNKRSSVAGDITVVDSSGNKFTIIESVEEFLNRTRRV
jgi:hypothetical protein